MTSRHCRRLGRRGPVVDRSAGLADACTVRLRRPLLPHLVAQLCKLCRGQSTPRSLLLPLHFFALRFAMRLDGPTGVAALRIADAKKVASSCPTGRTGIGEKQRECVRSRIHCGKNGEQRDFATPFRHAEQRHGQQGKLCNLVSDRVRKPIYGALTASESRLLQIQRCRNESNHHPHRQGRDRR